MPCSAVKAGVEEKGGILVSKVAVVCRPCIALLLGGGEGFPLPCLFAWIFSSFLHLLYCLYVAPRVFFWSSLPYTAEGGGWDENRMSKWLYGYFSVDQRSTHKTLLLYWTVWLPWFLQLFEALDRSFCYSVDSYADNITTVPAEKVKPMKWLF